MSEAARLHVVNLALEEYGLRWSPGGPSGARYRWEGEFRFGQRVVRFAYVMRDLEFVSLPKLELRHRSDDLPMAIAHLEGDGYCYAQAEGIVLDRDDPRGAALQCLSTMKAQIEGAFAKNQSAEVANEFPRYWGGTVVHALTPVRSPSAHAVLRQADRHRRILVVDDERQNGPKVPVAFIVFDGPLTFPGATVTPNCLSQAADWLNALKAGLGEVMLSACAGPEGIRSIVVVGTNTAVGFDLKPTPAFKKASRSANNPRRMVRANPAGIPIERFRVEQCDSDTILKRNYPLAEELGRKSIVLVGLGSIGGYVCEALVRSGAGSFGGRLTLIDPDTLTAKNLGRHHLGLDAVGQPKVVGSVRSARALSPAIDIHPVGDNVINHLGSLSDADLVIDATGEEAVTYAINEAIIMARQQAGDDKVATVLTACIHGNGSAAQTYLFDAMAKACLRCLHPRLNEAWRFGPMADGQDTKVIAGPCGDGSFVPYHTGAPLAATALVMATIDGWLRGQPSPRLRTMRLDEAVTRSRPNKDPSASTSCPACGKLGASPPPDAGICAA